MKMTSRRRGETEKIKIAFRELTKNMTKTLKLLAASAFVTIAAVTTTQAGTTNILDKLSVALTIYTQSSTTNKAGTIVTDRIGAAALTSSSLISALGTALGQTFDKKAYLAFVTQVSNEVSLTVVTNVVGTNTEVVTNTTTTVTNLPSVLSIVDDSVITPVPTNDIQTGTPGATLISGSYKTNGTELVETRDTIRRVDVTISNTWDFDLRGWATRNLSIVKIGTGKSAIESTAGDATWSLSGYGTNYVVDTNGTPVLVKGTITANYFTILKQ
jgi:hypothetical protein